MFVILLVSVMILEIHTVPNGHQKMAKLPTCLNLLKKLKHFQHFSTFFDLARLSLSSYCIFIKIQFQMAFTFDSMWLE